MVHDGNCWHSVHRCRRVAQVVGRWCRGASRLPLLLLVVCLCSQVNETTSWKFTFFHGFIQKFPLDFTTLAIIEALVIGAFELKRYENIKKTGMVRFCLAACVVRCATSQQVYDTWQ